MSAHAVDASAALSPSKGGGERASRAMSARDFLVEDEDARTGFDEEVSMIAASMPRPPPTWAPMRRSSC
jgi:hypothetical protein